MTTEDSDTGEAQSGPDPSILPLGTLGLVAPMNSLGFALNPGIGIVYDEVLVLLPAQTLVFTFQQHRALDEALKLPYDEAAGKHGIRVFRLSDIDRAELVRPFTGYRLLLDVGERHERWILQKPEIDEVRRCLSKVLGERFVDSV